MLVGWVAVVAQTYFAPLVIFPLLVGIGLGAMMVGLMRFGQVGNRPTIVLGAVAAALVTVASQHYFAYLRVYDRPRHQIKTRRATEQQLSESTKWWIPSFAEFMRGQAARGRPLPLGYVAEGWAAWTTWAVEGLLVLAAAQAMVIPAMRQPYCNRCRSWYRVIRSGRIDVSTARRLAELAEVAAAERPLAARYRLLSCNGGCGLTCFDLSWDESPGGTSSGRAWLDTDCRNRVSQVLDEVRADDCG